MRLWWLLGLILVFDASAQDEDQDWFCITNHDGQWLCEQGTEPELPPAPESTAVSPALSAAPASDNSNLPDYLRRQRQAPMVTPLPGMIASAPETVATPTPTATIIDDDGLASVEANAQDPVGPVPERALADLATADSLKAIEPDNPTTTMASEPGSSVTVGSSGANEVPAIASAAAASAPMSTPRSTLRPTTRRISTPSMDLLALEANHFTIQLTTLRDRSRAIAFLARYDLDPTQAAIAAIDLAGTTRYALLYGDYEGVSQAEAAISNLPRGIQRPWVRRVGPLRQRIVTP